MNIVIEKPPMWEEINKVFNVEGKSVVFCWGKTIFNPKNIRISPELIAHEEIHSIQQGISPEDWWKQYLVDPHFRLLMEMPAHRRQYLKFCENYKDRNSRTRYLNIVASNISSPLYGKIISRRDAVRELVS